MQDADGDTLADRILLTYSERIRHGVDHDGKYPYVVTGYRIRSVGAAKGKTITLALVEKATPDPNAKPAVRYRRTKSKPVRDRSGNQAAAQVFRATKAHGHKPTLVPSDTTPPETTIGEGPSGTVAGRGVRFTYSSPDPTATFECALDGATLAFCPAEGVKYADLADGPHTFRVRARDAAGNVDATPEMRSWSIDGDGDGSLAPADCAPDDPAINPSATDAPEMTFTDTNCDGIDGTEANAIFVSPIGNDASPGTRAAPLRTLAVAVAAAATANKQVYATFGIYTERLVVANGVGVYGGYGTDWSRSILNDTRITGGPGSAGAEGALAVGVAATTTLQHVTLAAGAGASTSASSYGIRVVNSPGLVLEAIVAAGGPGAAGSAGSPGRNGAKGKDGGGGGNGECDGIGYGGGGGFTGLRTGRQGGQGGDGGQEYLVGHMLARPGQAGAGVDPGPGGFAGSRGDPGGTGGNGSPGGFGIRGADGGGAGPGIVSGSIFVPGSGQSGTPGTDGSGGGGGGGGGGQHCIVLCDDGSGDGGGEGGDGGERGFGGAGGGGGGGSFGVFLVNSTGVVIKGSIIIAGNGGAGGLGGSGGQGGAFGASGPGSTYCSGQIGAGGNGGRGGGGGRGGDGGGGSGGPSVAIARQGTTITASGSTLSHGPGGAGGAGLGGTGANGQAADDLQF